VVGIDEAGYGPLLGPLVVSSVAMRMPGELAGGDLWRVLKKAVSKQRRFLKGRLLVTDSKKAYNRKKGTVELARTVLSFCRCSGRCDGIDLQTLGDLLRFLAGEDHGRLGDYAWYEGLDGDSLGVSDDELSISAGVLASSMAGAGIELLDLRSCCFDVYHYNRMVSAVRNKAGVLFTAVSTLIDDAVKLGAGKCSGETVHIIVDRQGGRTNYLGGLSRLFDDSAAEIKVLKCNETVSSYEILTGDQKVRIHFATAADDKYFQTALASMTSKYVRELLVAMINRYFLHKCPEVKPTAGYYTDGKRFIAELDALSAEYSRERLIRIR
jgi:ribonuclease HII